MNPRRAPDLLASFVNLAVLCSSFRGGGAERVCVSLANARIAEGPSVALFGRGIEPVPVPSSS